MIVLVIINIVHINILTHNLFHVKIMRGRSELELNKDGAGDL